MLALDLDQGLRYGAFDAAIEGYYNRYMAAEIRFVDEGKQPHGIKNVNRPVNIDAVVDLPLDKLTVSFKAGLTSPYLGYNGSGNNYKNNTGFTGGNAGISLSYKVTEKWAMQAQAIRMNYQQVDKTAYESFGYFSVGVKYAF